MQAERLDQFCKYLVKGGNVVKDLPNNKQAKAIVEEIIDHAEEYKNDPRASVQFFLSEWDEFEQLHPANEQKEE